MEENKQTQSQFEEFLVWVKRKQKKRSKVELTIYSLLLIVFSLFAFIMFDEIHELNTQIKMFKEKDGRLQGGIGGAELQIGTLLRGRDTIVNRKWLLDILNAKELEEHEITFTKGDLNTERDISFMTNRHKVPNGFRFRVAAVPHKLTGKIKEIIYTSSDSEFKDHILSSTDVGRNFQVEWYGNDFPALLSVIIEYVDCKTEVHMFSMESGKIIR